jgi:hypothetical protein
MRMADAPMLKAAIRIAKQGRAIVTARRPSPHHMFPSRLIYRMGRYIIRIAPQREKLGSRIFGAVNQVMEII